MDFLIKKYRNVFLKEAGELLDGIETNLLILEKFKDNTQIIDSIYQNVHALKGTSGTFGFSFVYEFSCKLVTIFRAVRENQISLTEENFHKLKPGADHLRRLLIDDSLSDEKLKSRHTRLMNQLDAIVTSITNFSKASAIPEKENNELKALWQIIIHTTESDYFKGSGFLNFFSGLAELGIFSIKKIENSVALKSESWIINLISDAPEQQIKKIFSFIDKECEIIKITDDVEKGIRKEKKNCDISILDACNQNYLQKRIKKDSNSFSFHSVSLIIWGLKKNFWCFFYILKNKILNFRYNIPINFSSYNFRDNRFNYCFLHFTLLYRHIQSFLLSKLVIFDLVSMKESYESLMKNVGQCYSFDCRLILLLFDYTIMKESFYRSDSCKT